MEQSRMVLVDKKVLPEIFDKVLKAKSLMAQDIAKNSSEACKLVDISRSAFYKYKDSVFFYEDKESGKLVTLYMRLNDEPGTLATVLQKLSRANANVLTVNQNIPVDGVAVVTIAFRVDYTDTDELMSEIACTKGVVGVKQV